MAPVDLTWERAEFPKIALDLEASFFQDCYPTLGWYNLVCRDDLVDRIIFCDACDRNYSRNAMYSCKGVFVGPERQLS
jgi:hypothetical protein